MTFCQRFWSEMRVRFLSKKIIKSVKSDNKIKDSCSELGNFFY